MFAIVQNGNIVQIIQPDVAFTIGEKQYSARFIRNATEAERKAVGVYEIIQGQQADQRFYWVTGPNYRVNEVNQTVEASYTATAKALEDKLETKEDGAPLYVQTYDPAGNNGQGAMVDTAEQVVTKGLKSQWIAQTKQTAGSLLAQTDWMVIRKAERNVDIPSSVATKRAAIVAECDRLEAAITAAADVDALAAVLAAANWPRE
jgi:ABC-type proline/glycine betaine transport system ATPase subunit